jgi:hypothetical protein
MCHPSHRGRANKRITATRINANQGSIMPNRKALAIASPASLYVNRGNVSQAEEWVFIAFCTVGFAATMFFISLSSQIGQAAVILTGQG